MTDFELEVERARQNNLEREAQLQLLEEEEKKRRIAEEQAYIEDVSSGDKQGPTLEPTAGEEANLSGDYRADNPLESFLTSQAIAAGGSVRNAEQYKSSEDMDVQNVEDFVADPVSTLAAKGTLETVSNAIGLVPWLKPVDEVVDKAIPPENDPTEKLIRDIGGLVVPSMLGGAGLGAVSGAVTLPSKLKVGGELSARLGLEALIAYSAGSSSTDENIAQTLNDTFGLSIPNATNDDDTPAIRRKKHVLEAAGFFALGEALGLGIKFAASKLRKLRGTDEASEAIVQKAPQVDPDYPLETAYKIVKDEREQVFTEEMVRRLEAGPGSILSLIHI